jgi:hypothetical protein
MSDARQGDGETQVWQGRDVEAALAQSRRTRKRQQGPSGQGAGGWQIGWRVVLWAIALGLGWYVGTHFFG